MDTLKQTTQKHMTNILFIAQSFYTPDAVSYYLVPSNIASSREALIELWEMCEFSDDWNFELGKDITPTPNVEAVIHYIYEA